MNEFDNSDITDEINDDILLKADYEAQFNPVNYTEIMPNNSKKSYTPGLRIFAFLLTLVIAVAAGCGVGYIYGRKSAIVKTRNVDLNLAARPKNDDQYTPAQVYEMLNEYVVGIRVYNDSGKISDASGVIYSQDGYVITNDHIYSEIPNPRFRIFTYNGMEYDAEYVAGDIISDLAVLKIKTDNKFNTPIFGDSNEIVSGENVVAIGRPNNAPNDSVITYGIISLKKRRMQTTSNYSTSLIQTDSAINPGNSGGVLANMYGQIIGITASKLAGIQYDAVGFAIPTTTVKRVIEQLIKHHKVIDRAKLGITYSEINSVNAQIAGLNYVGLFVDTVSEDSDIFGNVHKGDIITHINGTEITSDDIVLDIIEESYAGDIVKLTVVSPDGTVNNFDVKLKANIGESSYITEWLKSYIFRSGYARPIF